MAPREASRPDDKSKQTWGEAIRYIVGRKRAEEALGLLSAAGAALSSLPDLGTATKAVANYVVPYLSDWCRIDRFDGDGTPTKIAVAIAPKLPATLERTFEEFFERPDRAGSSPMRQVWQSRKYFLHADGSNVQLPSTNGAGHEASCSPIGTAMIVPIEEGNKLLGAVSCATVGVRKTGRYGPAELALIAEIARRLGSAFIIAELSQTNARLRQELACYEAVPGAENRKGMR